MKSLPAEGVNPIACCRIVGIPVSVSCSVRSFAGQSPFGGSAEPFAYGIASGFGGGVVFYFPRQNAFGGSSLAVVVSGEIACRVDTGSLEAVDAIRSADFDHIARTDQRRGIAILVFVRRGQRAMMIGADEPDPAIGAGKTFVDALAVAGIAVFRLGAIGVVITALFHTSLHERNRQKSPKKNKIGI